MRLKDICSSDYIIATSDYRFFKEIKDCKKQIVFLEANESNPYEKVWKILDQINEIVDLCAEEEYSYLFHITYGIEGGFPSRIAQMIINLDLICKVVREYEIDEIYLYDKKENWIINESIFLYAESRGIACHIMNNDGSETTLKTLKSMGRIEADIDNFLTEERQKIESIIEGKKEKIQNSGIRSEEVGVLYCCKVPYNKHVEWTLKRTEAIGGRVKVICFYDTEDVVKFRNAGLPVDCMEDYFGRAEFMEECREAKHRREAILNALQRRLHVSYLQMDLSAYFILKLRNHYYRELSSRVYVNVCAKNYFERNRFQYINIWVNTGFWETLLCYANTRKNGAKLFSIDSISFIRFMLKQPYQNMLSAVFLPNKETFEIAYTESFTGKTCFIPDYVWKNKNVFKADGIKTKIGFLPTGVVQGFTTFYFYYNVLFPLIKKLLDNYEVHFKYHPGLNDCWEEDVKREYGDRDNFKFYNQWEFINNVMDRCDFIITDISSVALDAAAAGKAVFCIVDEQGYDLISQHRGFSIYRNTEDMIKDMDYVLHNGEAFQKMIERQNEYLTKLTGSSQFFDDRYIRSVLHNL